MAKVRFSGHRSLHIDPYSFSLWFPNMDVGWRPINGEDWIDQIRERIHCRCRWKPLERREARETLTFFLRLLEGRSYTHESQIQAQIMEDLEQQKMIDLHKARMVHMNPGFHICRHRFVTLVEVAYIANSRLLAQALIEFANENQEMIFGESREHRHLEWEPAQMKLQELLWEGYLEEEYPAWPRGRDFPRRRRHRDWDYDWHYRALSAPPVRRCRSLDLRLAMVQQQALMPYTPPRMSPPLMLEDNPFDEMEMIAQGQEEIAQEIRDVKHELRQLQWRRK
jgi:hypothetical protein